MSVSVGVEAGPSQQVHARPQTDVKALLRAVWALRAHTGEVTRLVGLDRAVGPVLSVRGQRVALLRLNAVYVLRRKTDRIND